MSEQQTPPQPNPEQAHKIQHAPVKQLISEAKGAMAAMGPVTPDPDPEALSWGPPSEPDRQPVPEEVETLLHRLEGYQSPAEKQVKPQGQEAGNIETSGISLDDIHFHTYNEGPQEAVFAERKPRPYVSDADRRKRLQEQATELEEHGGESVRYLRQYMGEFNRYYGGLKWEYHNNSEEYNAMELLLARSGFARSEPSYSSGRHQPELIYRTMNILRTPLQYGYSGTRLDTERGASWSGIGRGFTTNPDIYAREILKKAQEIAGKDRVSGKTNLEPYDMDVCVMSALACGEVRTALELLKLAPEFFPDQTDAVGSAFSRMQNIILEARAITPELARSIDEGLLCLGEGTYAELGTSTVAKTLKAQAEGRLRDRLKEGRNDWYRSKEVADVAERTAALSPESLQRLVEEAASQGEDWRKVTAEIRARVQDVVDGKAANILYAELIRRMYPDLSIADQLEEMKRSFQGISTGTAPMAETSNRIDHTLEQRGDNKRFTRQTAREKSETVARTYFPGERQLVDMVYNPRTADYLTTLIGLLRYPDNLDYQLKEAFKNSSSNRGYGYDYAKDTDPRIQEGRKQLARRLVGGVSFLQTCIDDPETKALVEKEFGFSSHGSSLLTGDNLEKVQAALGKMFGDVADETSGMTLYESVLPDPDQQAEDSQVFPRLNAARRNEQIALDAEKTGGARQALDNSLMQRTQETEHMRSERAARAEILSRKQAVEKGIPALRMELESIEGLRVTNSVGKLLGRGVTELEKTMQLASKQTEIKAAEDALAAAETELAKHEEIPDTAYDAATRLAASLQKLSDSAK